MDDFEGVINNHYTRRTCVSCGNELTLSPFNTRVKVLRCVNLDCRLFYCYQGYVPLEEPIQADKPLRRKMTRARNIEAKDDLKRIKRMEKLNGRHIEKRHEGFYGYRIMEEGYLNAAL